MKLPINVAGLPPIKTSFAFCTRNPWEAEDQKDMNSITYD